MTIEIVDPGALASVQDPFGRTRWRQLGVPVGGAADPWSARLANRLAGNPDGAAVVEVTLGGAVLRFTDAATVAIGGGLAARVEGLPLPAGVARRLRPGSLLALEAGTGARAYVAVAGGIDVPEVLGSRSTDLRTGFGGHEGRALRAGDRLPVGPPGAAPRRQRTAPEPPDGPIRVVAGPHSVGLLEALVEREFAVTVDADRVGIRLDAALAGGGETGSMGLPAGAIQLPPDGRPIVMLADRPVTGGYLVPAVVVGADIGRVAQLRAGDAVRFASVSLDDARAAWRRAEEELAALEPLDEREDDELRWAGSHE